MSINKKSASLVGTIDALLRAVGEDEVKTAASRKRSAANTEVGGTSHPVKDVDDGTQPATEGARASEYTEDIKAMADTTGPTVDSVTSTGGSQDSVQMAIGLQPKSTGEDPSNETSSVKSTKDDPGTSHPAKADDGEKYSSLAEELAALCKKAEQLGEAICSWVAVNAENSPKEASGCGGKGMASKATVAVKPEVKKVEAEVVEENDVNKIAQDAYDLAGLFADSDIETSDKVAMDHAVVNTLREVIGLAVSRAEKCAEFYAAHFSAANQKLAEDVPPEAMSAGGAPPAEGAPAPGESTGEGGGQPSPEEEALLAQLLASGQGMGAEEAAAGMGGGGEGVPPGAGGEVPVSPEGEEIDPAMLQQILQELGISPEALQGKIASSKKAASKWKPKTAEDARKFSEMRKVVKEIMSR